MYNNSKEQIDSAPSLENMMGMSGSPFQSQVPPITHIQHPGDANELLWRQQLAGALNRISATVDQINSKVPSPYAGVFGAGGPQYAPRAASAFGMPKTSEFGTPMMPQPAGLTGYDLFGRKVMECTQFDRHCMQLVEQGYVPRAYACIPLDACVGFGVAIDILKSFGVKYLGQVAIMIFDDPFVNRVMSEFLAQFRLRPGLRMTPTANSSKEEQQFYHLPGEVSYQLRTYQILPADPEPDRERTKEDQMAEEAAEDEAAFRRKPGRPKKNQD